MILHHYDFSNYSEKVRLVLGLKAASWRSVIIPAYAPKPNYTPLTAGYRRTPALQVGADVFCDTQLICDVLEQMYPTPSLFGTGDYARARARAIAHWAESSMMRALALFITGINADKFPPAFHADRAALHNKPLPEVSRVKAAGEQYRKQFEAQWPTLFGLLDGPDAFILGATPGLVDFTVYEIPWFLRTIGGEHELPEEPALRRWMAAVAAVGHGDFSQIEAAEALSIAKHSAPMPIADSQCWTEPDIAPGTAVAVRPLDQHSPAEGVLLRADAQRITIAYESPEAGLVHVHFPRLGYRVRALG